MRESESAREQERGGGREREPSDQNSALKISFDEKKKSMINKIWT